MAYTYDDFVTAANGAGMLGNFSQDDLTITQKNPEYGLSMLKLQQDAGKATTTEQKLLAQEAVNQLRKTYSALPTTTAANTSATATSAAATPVTADETASSAVPQTSTGYTYKGQNAYQKALEAVKGFAPYSYDYKQDGTYGEMRTEYLGDNQAMENRTMNNAAVIRGGSTLPSYAGAAAGQSGNYYATRLNDIIPQLEQNAYEQYLKDYQMKNSQLDAATTDKTFDYTQWKQQQELELAAIQQKYANDLVLHQNFGQEAPVLPDLSRVGTGTSATDSATAATTPAATTPTTTTPAAEGTADTTAQTTDLLAPVYSYGKQNAYQAALDAVLNQEGFAWNIQSDPQYGSLRKSYLREGQRANDNALAVASAGSMGIPSSYAIRQAADAGNAYNEQLMNAVPSLKENAYGRYLTDFNNKVSALGQLNDDRELDYKQWLENYQLEEKKKQQIFDNAVTQYKLTGLTPEIAAALGIEYVAPAVYYGGSSGGSNPRSSYTLNDMVSGKAPSTAGNNHNTVAGQNATRSEINKAINSAVSSGKITASQGQALKQIYTGSGSGGRYAY